jgi:hypothetical protein
MTNQTKQFVNLSEITAFRFRCTNKKCGAELSLPLQENYSLTHPADSCPNCGSPWLKFSDGPNSSVVPLLEQIVASIRSLSTWPGVCEVSLEVRPSGELG